MTKSNNITTTAAQEKRAGKEVAATSAATATTASASTIKAGAAAAAAPVTAAIHASATTTTATTATDRTLDINEIKEYLPHRYPFLLVDRVVYYNEAQRKICGIKNVTVNEEFFNGHFPEQPVMPGVLVLEALAQVSGILYYLFTHTDPLSRKELFYLAGIDKARFKRIISPGDQVMLHSEFVSKKFDLMVFNAKATVNGELACSAEIRVVKGEDKNKTSTIDQRAIVNPRAKIGRKVSIGPFAIIGEHVEIGDGTWIGPNVVIDGRTKIGRNNKIFEFASIGVASQDKKYKGEDTTVEIGDDNVIREFCTIHRGTVQGINSTVIGNRNLLMNYVHVAHDCVLGNDIVLANNTTLAGHVVVGDFVTCGGFTKVLQHCSIGEHSFLAGNTDLVKDVPPYIVVAGCYDSVKVYGVNVIGLRRRGFSEEKIKLLEQIFDIVYRRNLTVQQVIPELEQMLPECPEAQKFIDVLQSSKKGIVR
jgi:UDP-N-acetylglucosamine acyltransferase